MVDGRLTVPLSPPNSPPMSEAGYKSEDYQTQHATKPININTESSQRALETAHPVEASGVGDAASREHSQQSRPPLRSHKSFPYSLGPSSRVQDEVHQDKSETSVLGDLTERVLSSGPRPTASAHLQQPIFGGSAPTSPVNQLSPGSPRVEEHDVQMVDEDIDFGDADEEGDGTARRPMTAAELRAHKRKMKRFRLTHHQTRFLMSEFARQAHPDAAHRERLSREIPGLSPRQVQVWFQNRRAKLKRLTTDDRERMMRSRALPADFDTTQALHSPFSTPNPNLTTPVVSSGAFPPFSSSSGVRPLTLDTTRRVSDYETYYPYTKYSTASTITPAMGGFAFTPPQSATETMSPGSAISHASAYNLQAQESPRRAGMGMPYGHPSGFTNHNPQMPPRIQIHERIARTAGEAVGSPLRSSMSYGMGTNIVSETRPERSNSLSDQTSYTHERPRPSRSATNPNITGSGSYGLGFSYSNLSMYPQMDQSRQTPISQPVVDLQQPRRSSSHLAGPPITYAQYPSANLSASQVSQYSNFSAGYVASSFQSPYNYQSPEAQSHQSDNQAQMPQQAQQSYTPIQTQHQHMLQFANAAGQQNEPGDNSDGGVRLDINY